MIWIPCELSSKFTNLIHQLWRIEQSGLCHFIVLIYDDLIVIVMWVCSAVVIQAWYCKLACSVSWLTQLSLSSSSLGMPHHQWNIRAEAVLWLLLWSLVYFLLHALSPLPFFFFFNLHFVLKKIEAKYDMNISCGGYKTKFWGPEPWQGQLTKPISQLTTHRVATSISSYVNVYIHKKLCVQ